MYPVLFRIPLNTDWFPWLPESVPIYGFGVMLFIAFLLSSWLMGRRAEQEGIKKELLQDLTIYLFIGGLLGARISYLLMQDKVTDVLDFLYKLPRIWDGGIILYGSLVGGFLAYLLYYYLVLRKQGITLGKVADIVAPALVLGIALGRLGCFFNGCCYGQVPTVDAPVLAISFPLAAPATQELVAQGVQTAAGFTVLPDPLQSVKGVQVEYVEPNSPAARAGLKPGHVIEKVGSNEVQSADDLTNALFNPALWPRDQRILALTVRGEDAPITCVPGSLGLHPTQIYETVSMFLLFLVLMAFSPFRTRDGQIIALTMMCYAVHRSLNELLRSDARPVGFESYGSLFLLVTGGLLMIWLLTRPAQYKLVWDSPHST